VPDHLGPKGPKGHLKPTDSGLSQQSGRGPVADKRETTQEKIRARLEALRRELERGHVELQKVEQQRKYLRETLLRIDGAVQVLEELVEDRPAEQNGIAPRGMRPASEPTGTTTGAS
jgi:hypothetical protein